MEKTVAEFLEFKSFNYMLEDEQDTIKRPALTRMHPAAADKEKADYIKSLLPNSPTLVYCEQSLLNELDALGCSPLVVDHTINPKGIRQLNVRD